MEEKNRKGFLNFIKESKEDRKDFRYVYNIVNVYKNKEGNYIIEYDSYWNNILYEKENLIFLYTLDLRTGKPVSWLERIHGEGIADDFIEEIIEEEIE